MKIYAGYIMAQNKNHRTVAASPQVIMANSREEAIGGGMSRAEKEFPARDGWFDKQCDFVEVPSAYLLRVR